MSEDVRKLNNEEEVTVDSPNDFNESENDSVDTKEKKFSFGKIFGIILRGLKIFYEECIRFPWYIVTHPIKGWEEFKREKKGKLWCALFFIACR